MHFIYVMCLKDKKLLEKHGYVLVKEDEKNHLWVFANKPETQFSLKTTEQYVLSDVLSL